MNEAVGNDWKEDVLSLRKEVDHYKKSEFITSYVWCFFVIIIEADEYCQNLTLLRNRMTGYNT